MDDGAILLALVIFVLRVMNYAISTLRMVVITRGRRLIAATMAALEAFIFAVVTANIVTDLDNLANLFAYCAGASVGSYLGMLLEARLVTGYMIYNIIAPEHGYQTAAKLRDAGFGVTETLSKGRDGMVDSIRSVVNKRDVVRFNKLVAEINPQAFVTVEEARTVQRGWVRMPGRDKLPG
jgi:uncharacterized protein YebE (UPF0316 family)